ncbi:MAG: hypothetical protein ACRDOU_12040 [Streptosporangiaceae bacterium]
MKRIAAVAALIVAMLAVPAAAAMASTSTSGSSPAGHSQFFCPPNPFQHQRHHQRHNRRHHGHHGRHHFFAFNNCNFPPPPPSGFCNGASFTFSWQHGASGLYEISGPPLYTGEQFSYNGGLYTIVLANTIAGSMELNAVNFGPTIFQGTANLC